MRDGDRRAALMPDHPQVELEADEEHVQNHAELRVDAQKRGDRGWKDGRVQPGRHPGQQRRPEKDPAHELADDERLIDEREEVAYEPRGHDDDGEREQQVKERIRAVHGLPDGRRRGERRLEAQAGRTDHQKDGGGGENGA